LTRFERNDTTTRCDEGPMTMRRPITLTFAALCTLAGALALPACKDKKGPATTTAAGVDGSVPGVLRAPVLDEEVEPNDRPEQATAILPGKAVAGRIQNVGKKRDVDHFLFTSQHPKGILRVEVSGVPGLNLVVSVVQKMPRKLLATANNGGAGAPEVIPNVAVTTGEYFIVVKEAGKKKSGADGQYTLSANVTPQNPGDEVEPNDTRPDAVEIAPGTPIRGYFGRRKDVDWYRVKLPENVPESNLRVELTGLASVPFATLSAQDEIEVVLKKGATGRGTNLLFPNVFVKANQRFLYLVAAGGKGFSVKDAYTITTQLTPRLGADEEKEPNDRVIHATPLAKNQKMKGFIAPAGDEDWYVIEAPNASIARITVTGVDNVDLVLSLHDPSGKEIVRVDEGKLRDGEIIPNAFIQGKALIRVAAKARQENVFQTYELTAEWKNAAPGEEREPNETAAQANLFELGGSVKGFIFPKKDVDVYRLDIPAVGPTARSIRFELRGMPKVPLTLTLKDAQGVVFAKAGPRPAEEQLTLDKPMPAGLYHVEIAGGGESNPRDVYELRVMVSP